ncbi:MAG: hypothetical protein GY816_24105 [Cytophagales bacterium]|nr:hypothetical protein [Cytophagales bacterium]
MRNTMKKFVTYVMALTLLFSVEIAFGQGYTFRVLANKGSNKVKKAGSGQVVALKTGATLNSGDALVASAGSYIGLMHKTGKTIEVRKAGTITVTDLEKKVQTGKSSVASRYAKFVSDKMNEKASGNYRSRLNATGAVSRAVGDGSLDVMIPENNNRILGDNIIVRWEAETEGATYVVTVKNINDDVIFTAETDKTSINLNLTYKDSQGEPEPLYLVTIEDKNNPEIVSAEKGIVRVDTDDELVSSLNGLKAEVPDDSALTKLIYASFFEENGLLLDALTKYEEAIELSPDIEDFQELYENFLITNGLSPE